MDEILSNKNKGKHRTKEQNEINRISHLGKKLSDITKEKMKLVKIGKKKRKI